MSSQKLSLRMMDTRLKKSTKRIFITLYTLRPFFRQNSYSYIICCLEREATSDSSILFLYLLSGLHLRQLLTQTNHSHHDCYFSSLLDLNTSILSRLTFFVSSRNLAKTTNLTWVLLWSFPLEKCVIIYLISDNFALTIMYIAHKCMFKL